MPIRDFQGKSKIKKLIFLAFVKEKGLIKIEKISTLQDTRIGFDGFHWLKNISDIVKEPLVLAIGGVPFTLQSVVQDELENLKYVF